MMGERTGAQEALFYGFSLEGNVPPDHMLRSIDRFVDLGDIREQLKPFYSYMGRPSIDPELMLRMLIVGYVMGIRSERRLCDEVHLNLAYRWFCRLGLDGQVPDHSTFTKNRHGRFRDSDVLRQLGYPKSSLSVLLTSLVAQGYLANGGGDQDYFPALKLARLGEWIPAALLGSDALLPMLAKLRDQTGETVTLTMAADLHMRCLHALIGSHPISLQVEDGVSFPMVGTAIGSMYLATQDDKAVSALLTRWAKQHRGQSKAAVAKARADVEDARGKSKLLADLASRSFPSSSPINGALSRFVLIALWICLRALRAGDECMAALA